MSDEVIDDWEYEVTETPLGIWRRYTHADGQVFAEFVSHAKCLGWRVLHLTWGICPETGRRIMAKGIVAIGRRACGVVAVGQLSIGVVAFGQLAIGMLWGIGQATTGVFAFGQAAFGAAIGMGQLVTGYVAVGQLAFGHFVLAQFGLGGHVWDMRGADPIAKQFFRAFF